MINAVDLFAGCGGLSLGFQNAGINIMAAFEFWDKAADCYEKNFDHPVMRIDLSDVENAVETILPYKPELIIGGPPCQDFSHAGKRIEAGRASLTGSYAEIIYRIRPNYFVMENVDRAQKSNAYSFARDVFKSAGYGLTEIVLDASLCGVPQKRKRFFCIGIGTKNYSSRGAKDVIFRCKRAEKMVPSNGEDEAHYIFALEQNEEFHCLSVNVRSQIKRAIKLKTEYETS